MELKLGKMTQKELAEWFGITHNSFRTNPKTKANKLELLKTYADYHIEGRSVVIDRIIIPEYSKAYHKIEELFESTWNANGIDSCARVGKQIYQTNKEVSSQIQLKTTQAYTGSIKRKWYGRNHMDEEGEKGISKYTWAKLEKGEVVPVSVEEAQIIKACSEEVYGKQLGERSAFLHTALKAGEISQEEFKDGMACVKDECYIEFIDLVEARLGFIPSRLSQLIKTKKKGAWDKE